MMKLFTAIRLDEGDFAECVKQIILAYSEEEALELASRDYGVWEVIEEDMSIPRVLMQRILY